MKLQELIAKNGKPLALNKGESVFRQGDQDGHLYLIEQGLLKASYCAENGSEHVKSFPATGDIIGSLTSTRPGDACSFSLRCLEDSQLLRISFSALQSASKTDLETANDLLALLLQHAAKKERREYEFLCLSAEQRYRLLLLNNKSLVDRVTQHEIARYLGITPVGLSRIKKRVSENSP